MDPMDGYDPLLGFPGSSNGFFDDIGINSSQSNGTSNFDPASLLKSEIRRGEDKSIPNARIPPTSPDLKLLRPNAESRKRNAPDPIVQNPKRRTTRGKPGKPGQPRPPGCNGKTSRSLNLIWQPPKDVGGFPVDSYQVQKREFVSGEQAVVPPWKDLFPKKGYHIRSHELKGLLPGSLTQFRVKAHNKIGWGKFSRASNPFPTERESKEIKKKYEGTVDPNMVRWDDPRIRLGKGAFGVVYRSAIGGYRGTTVAVKIERGYQPFNEKTEDEKEKLVSWLREVNILSSLRHPNLVLFMGACQCDGRLFILTEYMSGGSLEQAIYRPISPLKDKNWIQSLLAQVASAIGYLHSNEPRITHRDLKPANVLLDKTWVHAKVCDFGFARMHKKEVMSTLTKFAGTTPYMAPEALGEEDNISAKVDVYSFGIMCAEALTQKRPFPKYSNPEVMKAVCIRDERPYNLEGNALGPATKLIKQCMSTSPNSRPTFASIITNLTKMGWKMI